MVGFHPILKASLTSCTLYVLGDVINQQFIEKSLDWNVSRTMRFGLTGACLHGPWFYMGFKQLDTLLPSKTLKVAIYKSLLGQIGLFAPFVGFFLTFTALVERKDVWKYVKERYWDINRTGLYVWPLANIINFMFISSLYRVAYVNVVGLGWNTYLSFASHRHSR